MLCNGLMKVYAQYSVLLFTETDERGLATTSALSTSIALKVITISTVTLTRGWEIQWGWRLSCGTFGVHRIKLCLPVYDDLCLRFMNFARSCMAYQSHLVSFIARYNTMHGRFSSPVGRNIQRCAQRYACTVEDLLRALILLKTWRYISRLLTYLLTCLLRGPVRKAVTSCVQKSFSDDQFQTAYLLQECVMVRDGLAKLPDCFTVGDMREIDSYVSTCWLFSLYLSVPVFSVYIFIFVLRVRSR